jgi:arylsulfatase A-like enzyme
MTYWKGKIKPGVSDALVSQLDLFSSLSKLVGSDIVTEDSRDMLAVLIGETDHGREELILEATTKTALRSGDYIMIPPYQGPAVHQSVNIELGNDPQYQLYNLKADPGQKNNIASTEPEMLEKLKKRFEELRGIGTGNIELLELK